MNSKLSGLLVLLFLMFFGNVAACPVEPTWGQFMRTEKYNEALSYLNNNEKEIVHNYSQFCYDYYKAESYYKLGQLEKAYTIMKAAIALNPNSHKENPTENKKAVFYAIELAELYFSENNIDKSFEAADWATGRGNYDSKYYDVNNKVIDATGRLAELMGDLWVKKGKNDYAKLYYNVLDASKYSTEIKNKRALANGELTNYSIPQKTYTQPIVTENTYSLASETQKKGECKEGDCINGYGRFVYSDGKTYTGYWKNGKKEGKGSTYEKGVTDFGYWKNDEKITDGCFSGDCKNGYGSYDNGERTTYNGQWKDGKYNGEGTRRFQRYQTDITTEIGQWVDGKLHGYGQLIRSTYNSGYSKWEDDIYSGTWEDGKFVAGKHTYSDGTSYTGTFDGFWPSGECTKTLANGYYMKATFKKTKNYSTKTSKEKYYNNNDIEITEREFISVYASLINAIEAIPICLSGNCQNGYGITKYQNGDRYFGYSVNGKKEGLGFIWYADKVTKEYVSLTSLATKTVTTLGNVTYGIWENGIQTKSFDRDNFYAILQANPYYGGLWGYDNLGARERAEGVVLAQKQKEENAAAESRYYSEKMKNVSFSSGSNTSSSSNSSYGNGTGDAKMPDIIYKTVGGSGTIIYTHKQ